VKVIIVNQAQRIRKIFVLFCRNATESSRLFEHANIVSKQQSQSERVLCELLLYPLTCHITELLSDG
ncbi:MAG: hypothetical protein K0U89_21035, partial [Planctomycetes bacterium]|nr:hypothetical protein [Planctomycetota bacterium]